MINVCCCILVQLLQILLSKNNFRMITTFHYNYSIFLQCCFVLKFMRYEMVQHDGYLHTHIFPNGICASLLFCFCTTLQSKNIPGWGLAGCARSCGTPHARYVSCASRTCGMSRSPVCRSLWVCGVSLSGKMLQNYEKKCTFATIPEEELHRCAF